MAKGPKIAFISLEFQNIFFAPTGLWWSSGRSSRGCQANSSPRAASGWPRPASQPPRPPAPPEGKCCHHLHLTAILHLRYEVAVLRQEVILNVLERHEAGCARVLARPVTRDRHVTTRGLVLEPQLRPGLAEPEHHTADLAFPNTQDTDLRLHPAAWYRQWTRVRVPGTDPAWEKYFNHLNQFRIDIGRIHGEDVSITIKRANVQWQPRIKFRSVAAHLHIQGGWYYVTSCGQAWWIYPNIQCLLEYTYLSLFSYYNWVPCLFGLILLSIISPKAVDQKGFQLWISSC